MDEKCYPEGKPIAYRAARASCVCALLVFVVTFCGNWFVPRLFVELVSCGLLLPGFGFALVGLMGLWMHRTRGILFLLLGGLLVNGLLLAIFVGNFLAARARQSM